jgi:hypothetical protein
MSVYKIVPHPIRNFSGISKIKVPEGSVAMKVIALDNTHDIVHILVSQPIPPGVETEIEILTIAENTPFNEPDDDKYLQYIGSVAWDNGHKLHHVFEISKYEDEDEDFELVFEPAPDDPDDTTMVCPKPDTMIREDPDNPSDSEKSKKAEVTS